MRLKKFRNFSKSKKIYPNIKKELKILEKKVKKMKRRQTWILTNTLLRYNGTRFYYYGIDGRKQRGPNLFQYKGRKSYIPNTHTGLCYSLCKLKKG